VRVKTVNEKADINVSTSIVGYYDESKNAISSLCLIRSAIMTTYWIVKAKELMKLDLLKLLKISVQNKYRIYRAVLAITSQIERDARCARAPHLGR